MLRCRRAPSCMNQASAPLIHASLLFAVVLRRLLSQPWVYDTNGPKHGVTSLLASPCDTSATISTVEKLTAVSSLRPSLICTTFANMTVQQECQFRHAKTGKRHHQNTQTQDIRKYPPFVLLGILDPGKLAQRLLVVPASAPNRFAKAAGSVGASTSSNQYHHSLIT